MSMRDYGFEDCGIILTDAEAISFVRKWTKAHDEEYFNECFRDKYGNVYPEDEDNLFEDLELDHNILQYLADFTGDAYTIEKDGSCFSNIGFSYDDDWVVYIPLLHDSTLFTRAFETYEQMLDEHKRKYGEFLPEDFPWEERFSKIIGTYFG